MHAVHVVFHSLIYTAGLESFKDFILFNKYTHVCYFGGLLRQVGVYKLHSVCDFQPFEVLQDYELSLSWDRCLVSICLSVHFTVQVGLFISLFAC